MAIHTYKITRNFYFIFRKLHAVTGRYTKPWLLTTSTGNDLCPLRGILLPPNLLAHQRMLWVSIIWCLWFDTPFGKYMWLRMPFGISPAPEDFQRRIDVALYGLQSVVAVHDDIIVWGKGSTDQEASEDNDNNLRKLLQRCREVNLKLNREKVELKQTQINYLGHIISSDGLRTDPKKIDAVKQIPPPVDKAGVQRLLGMVGYLQRFAPNISSTAAPMREFVNKDINFRWDEHVHGKARSEVKKPLSEPPVLRYFDEKEQDTTLQCDASEKGLGACLMQKGSLSSMRQELWHRQSRTTLKLKKKCSRFRLVLTDLRSMYMEDI